MLAGVAAGVAEALDADPSLVRIAWALLTIFTGGIAFLVYVVMAIVVPIAPPGYETARSAGADATDPVGGGTPGGGTAGAETTGTGVGASAGGPCGRRHR
jgi:phage shock protein C